MHSNMRINGADRDREARLDSMPPPDRRLERQRGPRSFLTWSFFLAQAAAVDIALQIGAAQAADEDAASRAGLPGGPDSPDIDSGSVASGRGITPDDSTDDDGTASASLLPISANPASLSDAKAYDPAAIANNASLTTTDITGDGSSELRDGSDGNGGNGGDGDNGALPPTTGPDFPGIGIDIGAGDSHSLLGFGVTVDIGSGLMVGTDLDLNLLDLGPLQHNLLGVSASLDLDLGSVLNGGLGGVVNLLGSTGPLSILNVGELTGLHLSDAVGNLTQPVDALATSLGVPELLGHLPVVSLVEDGPVGSTLSDLTGTLTSALGFNTTGNTLSFPTPAVDATAQHDVLYSLGQYTDYNISLQSLPLSDAKDPILLAEDLVTHSIEVVLPSHDDTSGSSSHDAAGLMQSTADLLPLDELSLRNHSI
jgi:hypothetical protein